MTDELSSMLKVAQPENERRQCVTMTMAAAVEWRKKGRRPSQQEVVRRRKISVWNRPVWPGRPRAYRESGGDGCPN